ncbi:MAG: glycoside hydrolase N-terminal domain-containing protein [Lachnospiraceae bacterium]|nr:glycoside hydrolase N-terminal domain-containing protein [Lachnospiraceae bacterium]MDD3617363.1 glycoside hydrolase N-terminal domain-containing protein [Lachnospiraceae bacterium]
MQKLQLSREAFRWGEAFPIGNGFMGGMVYGGKTREQVLLTEETFFSGRPSEHNNQPGAADAFYQMREEISRGNYAKAHETAKSFIGVRGQYGTNLPVGSMYIEFLDRESGQPKLQNYESGTSKSGQLELQNYESESGKSAAGHDEKYVRTLDIEHGVAWIEQECPEGKIQRKAWCSHEDKVLVYEIESQKAISYQLSYENGNEYGQVEVQKDSIVFISRAYELMHCDELCGVTLCGYIMVNTDGNVEKLNGKLKISEAKNTRIYVAMESDFKSEAIDDISKESKLMKKVQSHVLQCSKEDIEKLKSRHEQDVAEHMNRCTLEVHAEDVAKEEDVTKGEVSVCLDTREDRNHADAGILFAYGRYLLLCSSREDSKLPAHLQGVFNDNVACRIGWTCDMHLDINTQMNYWPAMVTNLWDTIPPLFRWIEEDLVVKGRQTARESYGLEGWVAELVSNAWGFAAPYWAVPISPCPTGGVWILTHMWEYYETTKDKAYLQQHAYPVIKEAAEFFVKYLYEGKNGYLQGGPSISPENSFRDNESVYQVSNGCTYEILMIRELFDIYIQAYEILNQENSLSGEKCQAETESADIKLYETIKDMGKKLLPYRILSDGTIAEWNHDYPSADEQHRHTSHLLGLFPFAQITVEDTPKLADAAEKTIEKKLTPPENWEDTGWARSMLLLYEARLHHPQKAYEHLESMKQKLLEPNGMIIHPPTRGAGSFDNVYELDGNTGLTSGIAEMLLQSHNGCIQLLPALPKEWRCGKVTGLAARGSVIVDMQWQEGQLTEAVLCAKYTGVYQVKYGDSVKTCKLVKGIKTSITW